MTTLADLKKAELPEGFTRHDGKGAPVPETARVQCAIWTVDGVRLGRACPAYAHIWEWALHDDGYGAVVGYRLA